MTAIKEEESTRSAFDDGIQGGVNDKRSKSRALRGLLRYGFAFVWPVLVSLGVWREILPNAVYWLLLATAIYAYLLFLASITASKLRPALSKASQARDNQKVAEEVAWLSKQLQDGNVFPAEQLRQFAWSLLTPASVRRRVTDEYTPGPRTLHKAVTVEFSFPRPVPGHPDEAQFGNGNGHLAARGAPSGTLAVLTAPKKGELYDQLRIFDVDENPVPRMSHGEYHLLAASTLRALLDAAFGDEQLSANAQAVEAQALGLIVRFANTERLPSETKEEYEKRRGSEERRRKSVLVAIKDLPLPDDSGRGFLLLATELVAKLSRHYAMVVEVPAKAAPCVVRYSYTIIPALEVGKLSASRGIRARLHFLTGTRPVFLKVSARNAAHCQSYHLYINAPADLYLGDFMAPGITKLNGTPGTSTSPQPYVRMRSRSGQHYLHMYTRRLLVNSEDADPGRLAVSVRFFEVPPGSLGRAGTAALSCLAVIVAAGWTVTNVADVERIDTEIAAFLLAVPGLAAAWLGFEGKSNQLFEGTLTARLSSVATFVLSMSASVLLLLNSSGVAERHYSSLFVFGRAETSWTVLFVLAALHAGAICVIWWQRVAYYKRLATRPVLNSGFLSTY